jgi:uncharacterized protein YhjY with autotransporter beta-barrel domain
MNPANSSQASWRTTAIRGCGLLFAAFVMLWSVAALAQPSFTLTLQPNTIPVGTTGVFYSQQLTAVGGNGTYVFTTGDPMPTGITLNPNGLLSGTPSSTTAGTITVTATDSDGNSGYRPYTFNVGTGNSLTFSPGSPLPDGTKGVPYSQTVTANGGSGTGRVYSIIGGSLPTGLSLNPNNGAITGTPTGGGPYNFTVFARDDHGNTGQQGYAINIIVPITVNPVNLPNGTTGTPYNQTVSASNGTAPYSFAVTAGGLPPGLTLNANSGAITGTPNAAGSYGFTIEATDANNSKGNRPYNVTINTAPLTINPASLPAGQVGTGYSQTVTASGGNGNYSYAVVSGSLPSGLSLNPATGDITGNPSAGGTFNFTIQATDTSPNTGSRPYSVTIGANSLTVHPPTLPNGTRNVPYSQAVNATGGTGAVTFAVSLGALPAGLSLDANSGAITGTPSGSGMSSFTIRATDSLNNFGTQGYNVNIGTNSLVINPATLPAAVTGRPYTATVIASNGTGPYTYSVSGGALPPGLTLNTATGVISGTMTAPGQFSFTISALDTLGNTGSRPYSLTNRPDPALDPEVIGLVDAQAAAARRFASAQIDNLSRHLENLHNFNPCSVEFGISLPQPNDPRAQLYPGASPYSPSPGNAARSYDSPAGQVARRTPGSQDCEKGGWNSSLAAWAAGSVQFGTVMPDGSIAGGRFTTAGLTAGVDWRVHSDLVVGAAVGYGSDRTTIGSNGTRSNATSLNAALYASYSAFDPWFIDGTVGYGQLGYDNRRFVADDSTTVNGSRKGSYWFGSASIGYEFKYAGLRLSPYLRADFMRAELDAYAEQGASAELLTYAVTNFYSVGGTAGLRGSYDIPMPWGVLTPNARAEYRQTLDGAFQQSLYYTDLGAGTASAVAQTAATRGAVNTSLGLRARSLAGVSGEFEYGTSGGAIGKVQSQTVRAALKVAF